MKLFAFILAGLILSGCVQQTNTNVAVAPTLTVTPQPTSTVAPDAELQKQFEEIAKEANGKVGVQAVLIETGQSASLNAKDRFAMQSVYKLPIAMAALKQVAGGQIDLEEKIGVREEDFVRPGVNSPLRDKNPNGGEFTVRELIRLSVSESDGTASDVTMRLAGNSRGVMAYLDEIGISGMMVQNTEKEIFAADKWQVQYDNWATPEAAVALLTALHGGRGTTPDHREMLLEFMYDSPTGPDRLKGLLPLGTPVAHKTGTSGIRDGVVVATNDIGIITLPNGKRIAIAVFVGDSKADERTREGVIAKVAKAVWDKWSAATQADSIHRPDFNERHSLN